MDFSSWIGSVAGILTTIAFLPQVVQIYKTKQTRDISLVMYVVLLIGVGLWAFYGVLMKSFPIIAANSVVLVLCFFVIGMKLKYG